MTEHYEEHRSEATRTVDKEVNVRLWPSLATIVFLVCAATGNCAVCGFDRDYVGDAIDRR